MKNFILLILIVSNLISIQLQKPKIYKENKHKIKNWIMSEKLDGIRAYWDGEKLLSKNGNKIFAPKWFIKNLPNFELDGELWTKRNDFENIQNIVLDKKPSKDWNQITYNIFEVPNQSGNFFQRLEILKNWLKTNKLSHLKIIPQTICENKKHLDDYLEYLVKQKAEGIIIKNPTIKYNIGRSNDILKVKKFYDMEGLVVGQNFKNKRLKSLKVKLKNGIIFNLGGGFSKKERKNPPKIGEIITFKYFGLTKNDKPKFASFLRVRKKE